MTTRPRLSSAWCAILFLIGGAPLLAVEPAAERFTKSDYDQHLASLQKRLPHEGFSVVIQKPFVVIGDEPLETVELRAEKTVKWAVDHLKQEYFKNDPATIMDIWLFQDANSYYRAFRLNAKSDPSGYETLKVVLGEKDMQAFQERWEAEVLKLRFD